VQTKSDEVVKIPPAIASLGMSAEEIAALRHRGFVCRERRSGGLAYGKLRYRVRGKQRVKYLGKNEAFLRQVEEELLQLQAHNRLDRTLRHLTNEANRVLHSLKARVEPVLDERGYVFHGRAVRKPRTAKQ